MLGALNKPEIALPIATIFLLWQLIVSFKLLHEIVRDRLVSVRAYDARDFCLYDLGDVRDGREIDALLARALADRRTDFVNIHTARPGCFLCRVERA